VEIRLVLKLAGELKAAKLSGTERRHLKDKNIALIFEKDSTRTRTGFEVAAYWARPAARSDTRKA
jgi:ornithine carbamoyltransferase